MGSAAGRLRGGPPNNAASRRSSSRSGPSGHMILAASARCKYSCAVPRPIEQLRAIARRPRPTSNFSRRTSLILRTDNLLAGKLILPFEGRLPAILLSSAFSSLRKSLRRSRTPFRDRPETVRLHRGIGVHLHPESRSGSSRNTVRHHPGIAFILPRIPQKMGKKGARIGGKRSLETMTPEERTERAKKASMAAAKKRTADRIARTKGR